MMNIYYLNSAGEKLDLLSEPYRLQTGDIFNYAWEYEYRRYSSRAKITRFYKNILTLPLTLGITGRDKESYNEAINRFHEVTERDVISNMPGKLYVIRIQPKYRKPLKISGFRYFLYVKK